MASWQLEPPGSNLAYSVFLLLVVVVLVAGAGAGAFACLVVCLFAGPPMGSKRCCSVGPTVTLQTIYIIFIFLVLEKCWLRTLASDALGSQFCSHCPFV